MYKALYSPPKLRYRKIPSILKIFLVTLHCRFPPPFLINRQQWSSITTVFYFLEFYIIRTMWNIMFHILLFSLSMCFPFFKFIYVAACLKILLLFTVKECIVILMVTRLLIDGHYIVSSSLLLGSMLYWTFVYKH